MVVQTRTRAWPQDGGSATWRGRLAGVAWQVLPRGGTLPEEAWRTRHRGILALVWLHAVVLVGWRLLDAKDLLHALPELTPLPALALLAGWGRLGSRLRGIAATTGLLVASMLLVHLTGGLIEAHFHFFVVLAIVTLYQDWAVFLLAVGCTDHLTKPIKKAVLLEAIRAQTGRGAVGPPAAAVLRPDVAPAAPVVLDPSALQELSALRRPGAADPVPPLVATFVRVTEGRLAEMRRAAERGDAVELHRLAHAQKGSSGTYGAAEMYALASRLDDLGQAGGVQGADALISALEAAFGRAREALDSLLAPAA